MTRTTTLAVALTVLVTGLLAAQAAAVPGVTAQQEEPPTDDGATETPPGTETETPTDNETETPTDNETAAEPSVTFDDQTSNGTTVTVSDVTLPEGGYVVIHDELLQQGDALNSVIGASEYLPPGQYDNVTVRLFEVPGADFGQAATDDETTPTTANETDNATTMTETGTATETETEAGTETETDTATETETGTATETETGTEAGTTTETETETGTATENETTTETPTPETDAEAEPEADTQMRLTGDRTLTAMLHVDSNDNQTFDYVATFSLEDDPYLVGGDPVTDSANVTVANETAGTEETPTDGAETETPTEGPSTETETPAGGTEAGTPTETGTPGEATG